MCPTLYVMNKLKPPHTPLFHVNMLNKSGIIGLRIQ